MARFPFPGTTIDESSGSTGRPYDWIRGRASARSPTATSASSPATASATGPLITLNALSMGAWAAGINMSLGMNRHGVVKSIGPGHRKILTTLRLLGPGYRYPICGYPPFLKHLLDVGDAEGFPWADYELHGLVGGEGMTEELRDYLLERFRSVYSGYGATDLEVGMAAETPVSIAVRRLARARPDIRAALFGDDSRLPMVFQYNPLIHWLEVNARRASWCSRSAAWTCSRRASATTSTTRAGCFRSGAAGAVLRGFGYDLRTLGAARRRSVRAAGCRGSTWCRCRSCGSTAGATPRSASWAPTSTRRTWSPLCTPTPTWRPAAPSFQLRRGRRRGGTRVPASLLELADGRPVDDAWPPAPAIRIRDGLAALNRDYRTSLAEFPAALLPIVRAYARAPGRSRRTPTASSSGASPRVEGTDRPCDGRYCRAMVGHLHPDDLIARGNTSDVWRWSPTTVVKVLRPDIPRHWAGLEADITRAVHEAGLPAPATDSVVEIEGRPGVVLECIDGVSMWSQMKVAPEQLPGLIEDLVDLQVRVHAAGPIAGIPDLVTRLHAKIDEAEQLPEPERGGGPRPPGSHARRRGPLPRRHAPGQHPDVLARLGHRRLVRRGDRVRDG